MDAGQDPGLACGAEILDGQSHRPSRAARAHRAVRALHLRQSKRRVAIAGHARHGMLEHFDKPETAAVQLDQPTVELDRARSAPDWKALSSRAVLGRPTRTS